MKKFRDQIKNAWDENPMQVIVGGAIVLTVVTKFLNATTAVRRTGIWEKEINRRIMMNLK